MAKNIFTRLLKYYFNSGILEKRVFVVFKNKDHKFQKAILERLDFFLKPFGIEYKVIINPFLIPLYFKGAKLIAGYRNSKIYAKQSLLCYNVDPLTNPLDGWEYHKLLTLFFPFTQQKIDVSCKRIEYAITNIKNRSLEKVYLFGTGRSLEDAMNRCWDDGYKIVCNTIVKDAALWNYLKPDFIVAADAIYHYGNNSFAKAFCQDLENRLNETPETYFVYPSIFHAFNIKRFEKFHKRLIPIPQGLHKDLTNNLLQNYELPALGNVLNNMLLPLGMNISNNVYLWGFNGRAPNDNDFWRNSEKHFYASLVNDIKENHPYFYEYYIPKGKEDKYVEKYHGDELDNSLKLAEKAGWKIVMMHETYTKALQLRHLKIDSQR